MNEVWDKVDILHADKYQCFLEGSITMFGWCSQAYLKRQSNCTILNMGYLINKLMPMTLIFYIDGDLHRSY